MTENSLAIPISLTKRFAVVLLLVIMLLGYYNTVFAFSVLRYLHSANLQWRRQREVEKQKKDEDSSELQTINNSQEFHLSLKNVFSMVTAYLGAGTVLFSLWEEWSLFESFYYCFMTITTYRWGLFQKNCGARNLTCRYREVINWLDVVKSIFAKIITLSMEKLDHGGRLGIYKSGKQ